MTRAFRIPRWIRYPTSTRRPNGADHDLIDQATGPGQIGPDLTRVPLKDNLNETDQLCACLA
jgi:hypothetical protein